MLNRHEKKLLNQNSCTKIDLNYLSAKRCFDEHWVKPFNGIYRRGPEFLVVLFRSFPPPFPVRRDSPSPSLSLSSFYSL